MASSRPPWIEYPSFGAGNSRSENGGNGFMPASPPPKGVVRIIPLGGLGEIGLNMIVYECGEDIVVVDCGQMFPEEEMLGVDMVVPDASYVFERADRVRGILLTHGHEDHIGALPYILPLLPAPVYGAPFTLELLREKLIEHHLDKTTEFRPVKFRQPIALGAFECVFAHVTHSIVGSAAIILKTPAGIIIHTGDYKIDPCPPDGEPFDFYTFGRMGEEGVLALLADSTNVEMSGSAPSEKSIEPELHRIFSEAPRAIVAATFSSSIHRLKTLIEIAAAHKRKVFATGLNLERNLRIARSMGYIKAPERQFADLSSYASFDPARALVLTTGSQGEPLSALSRMSHGSHKQVKLLEGDTVILSSRMIPGNERSIYRVINSLSRRGVHVFYERIANVHVSGHCYSGEMAQMIEMVNPRYLIPIHGESRHLRMHRDLGLKMGLKPENIKVIENGDVLELSRKGADVRGRLAFNRILVDGKSVGEVGEVILRDRMHLGQDGMIVIFMAIDHATGKIVSGPDIVSRGFIHMDQSEVLIEKIRQIVLETFEECDAEIREDSSEIKEEIRRAVRSYLRKEIERFPMILPVVMEI
ncbi:MAG: ribonuclease J [Candidatus Sumerlaeota bacterium]|nr:ribonuclease J [Candidatus Sumerlaeota bacterium]